MAVESNFSFNQIAKCSFIRECLKEKFPYKIIPKGANQVARNVIKFYENAKDETIKRIANMKKNGKKFSDTLDELTSNSVKRFLNINVHFPSQKAKQITLTWE